MPRLSRPNCKLFLVLYNPSITFFRRTRFSYIGPSRFSPPVVTPKRHSYGHLKDYDPCLWQRKDAFLAGDNRRIQGPRGDGVFAPGILHRQAGAPRREDMPRCLHGRRPTAIGPCMGLAKTRITAEWQENYITSRDFAGRKADILRRSASSHIHILTVTQDQPTTLNLNQPTNQHGQVLRPPPPRRHRCRGRPYPGLWRSPFPPRLPRHSGLG